uniref:UDP-glucosyltransferase 709K1 n=1 Tax=Centella asiatica TaxID=48106 RepID=A0A2I7M6E5_CENAS|nr:UDP-glucosyltransferase 709K1 [Centella asiatica]
MKTNYRQPHVVILPFPAQGHIKPMFMLGKLLCNTGINVTLVNTDQNHNILSSSIDKSSFYHLYPGFRFMALGVGPPEENIRRRGKAEIMKWIISTCHPKFNELMIEENKGDGKITCVIADGYMSFAIDVAKEFDIPVISFRTYNATCTWLYFHLEELLQSGEIPVQDRDMDQQVTCIPGLENIVRRRDLPEFCRHESGNSILQFYMDQTSKMKQASALILNTFEELESPIVSNLRSIFQKVYTIGPLQGLLESRMAQNSRWSDVSDASLRPQDQTCISWLDNQAPKSVIYISFGSLVVLTRDQLMEFWHGLVNSGLPFLWVIRPGLIMSDTQTPPERSDWPNKRGFIVDWAPQEEVLAHRAIGGFLSHGGWNSTLESIWAGKSMICWPQFADQQVNSRCVEEMWRIGLDMKDTCDKSTVEKMVKDLMDSTNEQIQKSTARFASMAHNSVSKGGSSYRNIEKLIADIKVGCFNKPNT